MRVRWVDVAACIATCAVVVVWVVWVWELVG
jgi:hypothetical protein